MSTLTPPNERLKNVKPPHDGMNEDTRKAIAKNKSDLKTILEEYKTGIRHNFTCRKNDCYQIGSMNQEHFGITQAQALAKIEGMIPQKKTKKTLLIGQAGYLSDKDVGYNEAIEDMKANMKGEKNG